MAARLARAWFERDAPEVAPDLLNKLIVVTVDEVRCSGRIIETEAYMPDDPASHTFNGETPRNTVMFGPPGHLYVYLSYGIHQCANVVTGPVGSGQAVLLRAIEPVEGIDVMRTRRGRPDRELANGPGKLCQALGIGARHNGVRLGEAGSGRREGARHRSASSRREGARHERAGLGGEVVEIVDDGRAPPASPLVGVRVGITKGAETPWRFRVADPQR